MFVCGCVYMFWCAGVGVFLLARAYGFSLILFYTTAMCVFVYVRAVMCAQFCMIPFYFKVCVYAYVCVCVLLCWCAHTGFP